MVNGRGRMEEGIYVGGDTTGQRPQIKEKMNFEAGA